MTLKGFATKRNVLAISQPDAIRLALMHGYTSTDEGVFTPAGVALKVARTGKERYPRITLYLPSTKGGTGRVNVLAHRFVAYFHYGELALMSGTQVRHLNGDSGDCRPCNLGLGDASLNAFDKPPEVRSKAARTARHAQMKQGVFAQLADDAVRDFRTCPSDSLPALAAQYGVSIRTARRAASSQTYGHVL